MSIIYKLELCAIDNVKGEIELFENFLSSLREEMQPEISLVYRGALRIADVFGQMKFLFYGMPMPPSGLISNVIEEKINSFHSYRQNQKL